MKIKCKSPDIFGSLNDDSVVLSALLHDICKADGYFLKPNGNPGRSLRRFIGHGAKSDIMLLRLRLGLTEDEMLAIRWYMGKYTFPRGEVDKHYKAAEKSSAKTLIALIQKAHGMAAHSR